MAELSYNKELARNQILRLRKILAELPPYVKPFIRSIEQTTQPRTRIGYAYDLQHFLEYLLEVNPAIRSHAEKISEITLADLDQLQSPDFDDYLDYLSYYVRNGREYTNDARSKKRKLCALRVFFAYLYNHDLIHENVTTKVKMPKIHEKTIVRMEANEVADFLDNVEYGTRLTDRQQKFHEKTEPRDLAMMTLMLSTGIRVSELVGLNIRDVDFENDRIKVTRKGGNEAFVFFSDEAETYLRSYMEIRQKIEAKPGHEDALFLSSQRRRISVRAMENLVKKYASVTTPMKHITPHKLRSTYGTELYQETGDIYLVADVLGHKDVNTTKKHYAAMDEMKKRNARNIVTLRENDTPGKTNSDNQETSGNPSEKNREKV